MRKIKLYIAISLDGYIARPNGDIDWLDNIPNPRQIDHGYYAFYETLDTVIMGRLTYEKVLSFGVDWPYPACQTLIVSSRKDLALPTPKTTLMETNWVAQVKAMQQSEGKDIWLIGGGQLITGFLNEALIDEMILNVFPVILGEGIPLFPNHPKETYLEFRTATSFETGIVNLEYVKKG